MAKADWLKLKIFPKIKISLLIFFFLVTGVFIFGTNFLPQNQQFRDLLSSKNFSEDAIIVFNSGGWGDTPVKEAKDLSPIIEGVHDSLEKLGYDSIVIPFARSKEGFWGKVRASREFFSYFDNQSKEAAATIEDFLNNNPGKKIFLVGLSNGAAFADQTMKKIGDFKDSVFAIEIGIPFWQEKMVSDNILRLDNGNKDSLTSGQVAILLATTVKAPFEWFLAKLSGSDLSFSLAFDLSTHKYPWDSPEIKYKIISFLERKVK